MDCRVKPGDDALYHSRDASASELLFTAIKASRGTDEQRREAKRRKARSPRTTPSGVARPERGPLTFRRFTAALVPAVYRQKLSPGRVSRDEVRQRYCRLCHRA
jgi:hypothetical protein